ncbi:MAG TPA: signal peptidase I [Chloroflexi bacterium]|nr:signal peptidase I [Chloroflexota bacterium]
MNIPSDPAVSGKSSAVEDPLVTPETSPEVDERLTFGSVLREIFETALLAGVIWLIINFATARYVVEGISMEPTLHTGQYLIVNRLAYRFGTPQRGDVIVFDFPGNTNDDYVKRIIGLPGETVTIENGHVYIDGVELDEPYTSSGTPNYQGTWYVPPGSYFVMGDNRPHSSDSRSWGMLDEEYIVGKAWLSYWPPRTWGVIPHYEYQNLP